MGSSSCSIKGNHIVVKTGILVLLMFALGIIGCDGDDGGDNGVPYWQLQVLVDFGHRPMPSPDGRWIAFGGTGDSTGIWVLDQTTGNKSQLTDESYPHRWDYQWTIDSQALVFGGAGESGTSTAGIWHVTCPGGVITRLWAFGGDPDVAPSNEAVCFAGLSVDQEESGIWMVGIYVPQIYRLNEEGLHPRYSPSGLSIAYILPSSYGNPELHVMNHEGLGDRLICNDILSQEWSDNETLICMTPGSFGVDIVKVVIELTPQITTILTGGSQFCMTDAGDFLVFQKEENGHSLGLHISSIDGGGSKPVASSGAYPQFLPSDVVPGSVRIVFEDTGGIIMASPSGSN